MLTFLKFIGAVFLTIVILILLVYFYIRKKLRGFVKEIVKAVQQLSFAGVPPFRIKLRKFEEDDKAIFEVYKENGEKYQKMNKEVMKLGFERIEEFYEEDMTMPMTVYVLRQEAIYCVVYCHPGIGVWCDIYRRYKDNTSVTYANAQDSLMDTPEKRTVVYHQDMPVSELLKLFREESPKKKAIILKDEDLREYYEKVYAEEMNWRIKRGGATEEEIRRIAERDGTECTQAHIDLVQHDWHEAITEFFKKNAIKRLVKLEDISTEDRIHLEEEGILIHERMREKEILKSYDDHYELPLPDDDPEDDDLEEEEREELRQWESKLEQIRESLLENSPQETFRQIIEADPKKDQWTFKYTVDKPVPGDFWIHHYQYEDDEYEDDKEDEYIEDFDFEED